MPWAWPYGSSISEVLGSLCYEGRASREKQNKSLLTLVAEEEGNSSTKK